MIPLNKPGYQHSLLGEDYIGKHFADRSSHILSTAGDGLNLIYRTLKEERGALRVAVSPLACFQAIYPIVVNGHTPVFIDIDKETLNMDEEKLMARNDLDAVELIHLGGNPNRMEKICQWSQQHNIIIIEDCAQALGSHYNGKELGTFGDFAVFSLIKNIHASMGGLLLSKTDLQISQLPQVSNLLSAYRRIKKYFECHSNHHSYNPWNLFYWLLLKMKEKGVQNISTSIYTVSEDMDRDLRKALSSIDVLNKKRVTNASYMINKTDHSRFTVQRVPEGGESNRNRLLIRLAEPVAQKTIEQLRKAGIAANNLTQNYLHGFQPHVANDSQLAPYYRQNELECYDAYFNHIIAIPCSPFLNTNEMDYIINKLNHTL